MLTWTRVRFPPFLARSIAGAPRGTLKAGIMVYDGKMNEQDKNIVFEARTVHRGAFYGGGGGPHSREDARGPGSHPGWLMICGKSLRYDDLTKLIFN